MGSSYRFSVTSASYDATDRSPEPDQCSATVPEQCSGWQGSMSRVDPDYAEPPIWNALG